MVATKTSSLADGRPPTTGPPLPPLLLPSAQPAPKAAAPAPAAAVTNAAAAGFGAEASPAGSEPMGSAVGPCVEPHAEREREEHE